MCNTVFYILINFRTWQFQSMCQARYIASFWLYFIQVSQFCCFVIVFFVQTAVAHTKVHHRPVLPALCHASFTGRSASESKPHQGTCLCALFTALFFVSLDILYQKFFFKKNALFQVFFQVCHCVDWPAWTLDGISYHIIYIYIYIYMHRPQFRWRKQW